MMNETIRVPRDVSIRRVKRTEEEKPEICGRLNDEMSTSKPKMQFCQKVERGIGIYIQELFFKRNQYRRVVKYLEVIFVNRVSSLIY